MRPLMLKGQGGSISQFVGIRAAAVAGKIPCCATVSDISYRSCPAQPKGTEDLMNVSERPISPGSKQNREVIGLTTPPVS